MRDELCREDACLVACMQMGSVPSTAFKNSKYGGVHVLMEGGGSHKIKEVTVTLEHGENERPIWAL